MKFRPYKSLSDLQLIEEYYKERKVPPIGLYIIPLYLGLTWTFLRLAFYIYIGFVILVFFMYAFINWQYKTRERLLQEEIDFRKKVKKND